MGLFDDGSGGNPSFFNFNNPAFLGLLGGLGQASMPSRTPVPFGAAMGLGAQGLMQGQQQGLENLIKTQQMRKLKEEADLNDPNSESNKALMKMLGIGAQPPSGATPLPPSPQFGAGALPGPASQTPSQGATQSPNPSGLNMPLIANPQQAGLAYAAGGPPGLRAYINNAINPWEIAKFNQPSYGDKGFGINPDGKPDTYETDSRTGNVKWLGVKPPPNIEFVNGRAVDKNSVTPGTTIPRQEQILTPAEIANKASLAGAETKARADAQTTIPRQEQILSPAEIANKASLAAAETKARTDAQLGEITDENGNAIGTLGTPIINPNVEGYTTKALTTAGGLTQSSVDRGALDFAITNRFPAGMGIGSTGAGGQRKVAIQNRAGEIDPNGIAAVHGTELHALSAALNQQTTYANTTERSVKNADAGLEQLITAFKGKVNNNQMPVANVISNAIQYHFNPGDISAFRAGLQEVATEYANVFARNGQVTDLVRNKAAQIANGDLSIDALKQTLDEVHAQGDIVVNGSKAQAAQISGQIHNILGTGTAPQTQTMQTPSPSTQTQRMPSPASIQALKMDPTKRALFDQAYGAGAAAKILGN